MKNNGNPEFLKKWAEEHPEEALRNRQKGTEALIKWNKEHQEQSRANLALGPQANKEKNGKKIVCVNTGQVFNSIHEAEAYFGTYKDAIGRCLRGQLNTAGKDPVTGKRLKWKYLDASEE